MLALLRRTKRPEPDGSNGNYEARVEELMALLDEIRRPVPSRPEIVRVVDAAAAGTLADEQVDDIVAGMVDLMTR